MDEELMNIRNCHILCVEDEEEIRQYLTGEFNKISRNLEITYATCRDDAIAIIESERFFDYITLDLTIPATNGSFEKSTKNGLAVLGKVKELSQGTPVMILSGTGTLAMVQRFLETSNNVDIWSEGNSRPTISFLEKDNISELEDKISPPIYAVLALHDLELNLHNGDLPIAHDRLIRIFAKNNRASMVSVTVIGGGYSNAKVYSLVLKNDRGGHIHHCIAKCGLRDDIDCDSNNFNQKISMLKPEATPRQIGHLRYGAKSTSAVFYGLTSDHKDSYFMASKQGLITDDIQNSLIDILDNWHSRAICERKRIKDIRRSLLSDEKANELIEMYKIDNATDFEEQYAICKISCIHGDLHGENIRVDTQNGLATLIDYGDVKNACSILDPLTLECSFLFHGQAQIGDWPLLENLKNWSSIDDYIKNCPYSDEVKFCRTWINEIGAGKRELAACLYSYALLQLKHDDTNKDLAIELINVAQNLYQMH
ncbi:MAG: CheY-like chemotaxis protein [Cocleimonas sp.]|jgi:CheY-like chemotaxis protein